MAGIDPRDERPAAEPNQVDPLLQEGRVQRWTVWALAVAIAVVLGVVFWGLTSPNPPPAGPNTAKSSAPAAPATTGSGAGQTGR